VPEKPTIVSHMVTATFGLWFPFFRWMARTLPPLWVARLAEATAERAIWERERVREAILDNFAAVLDLPKSDRRVERAGREMVSRHSRFWIDLLRYAGRPGLHPRSLVRERIGDEHLLGAQAEGRGAVLLTAHVGNFELGGLFLKDLGLDAYVVYVPDPSRVIEAHRESARRFLGVKGIPVTSSPFSFVPILAALKKNGFVAIQGDRDVSGTGLRFPFFGRSASFPFGPFRLAQVSGAPVIPVFVLQDEDWRYRTVVHPAIRIPPAAGPHVAHGDSGDPRLRTAMETFVGVMARTIRENPTQWYLFTRFWEDGD